MSEKSQKENILHFKGELDYDKIGDLISTLKQKMKERGVQVGLYKKLLTLVIESLENIVRYSNGIVNLKDLLKKHPPEMLISHHSGTYTFEVSNLMQKNDIPGLEERLLRLNRMDHSSLKKLYKATITDGKFSEKGGAGLGIIEMAKISDEKLDYTFTEVNTKFSVYKVSIQIHMLPSASA